MSEITTVKGFVVRIFEKNGTGRNGKPYTLYSVKLVDENGEEDSKWYQFGFDKPPFKADADTDGHGDYVQFDVEPKNATSASYIPGSGKIVKNGPSRSAKKAQASATGGNKQAPKHSAVFGDIGGYYSEDDIRRITMSASIDYAIARVKLLVENKALPLTSANSKANEAARFEEINAAIDKFTVQHYFDAATPRLLALVEDPRTGDDSAPAPIPDAGEASGEEETPEEEFSDDFDDEVTF